jgi:hypothetical protein
LGSGKIVHRPGGVLAHILKDTTVKLARYVVRADRV